MASTAVPTSRGSKRRAYAKVPSAIPQSSLLDSENLTLTRPRLTQSPADLFHPILSYVNDMSFLWEVCRKVSRDFSAAVERIFVSKQLSKTYLHFEGGWLVSFEHGKVFLSGEFVFDRLDPNNRSCAIFVDKQCPSTFRERLALRLRRRIQGQNPPQDPKMLVQVRREIRYIAVPQADVDVEKVELSFEWKGLYSAFYRDGRQYAQRQREEENATWEREIAVEDAKFRSCRNEPIVDMRKELCRKHICRGVPAEEDVAWTWNGIKDKEVLEKLQIELETGELFGRSTRDNRWKAFSAHEYETDKDEGDECETDEDEDLGSLLRRKRRRVS